MMDLASVAAAHAQAHPPLRTTHHERLHRLIKRCQRADTTPGEVECPLESISLCYQLYLH